MIEKYINHYEWIYYFEWVARIRSRNKEINKLAND